MKTLLYMTLGRAPKWWPRDARGKVKPVGVLAGGDGWVAGDGQPMTARQIAQALELLRVDYKGARPRFTRKGVRS